MKAIWFSVLIGLIMTPVHAQAPAVQTPALAKETPLLSIATRVETLNDVTDDTYAWVSSHQVLFFRLMPLTQQQIHSVASLESQMPKGTPIMRYEPMIFNTQSGKLAFLEPFATRFPTAFPTFGGTVSEAGEPNSAFTVYAMEPYVLSHDGKWLFWASLSGSKPIKAMWVASRLDGGQDLKWPAAGVPTCAPDNEHWVELEESEGAAGYDLAVIHDLRAPSLRRKVKIDPPEDGTIQGIAADDSLVLSDFDDDHPEQGIKIMVYNLSGDSFKMQSYTLAPPTGLRAASEAALSPAGDKLAWIFDNNYEMLGPNRVGTYLLCTSDFDGTHMHVIGSMQGFFAPKPVNHQLYYWPETLRWLPDGKHVSFIFRNALYVVPVDDAPLARG